jgi:hypothetical protein
MILESLRVPVGQFEEHTGWALEPHGACRGDICVPLGDAVTDGDVDVAMVAERLGMPVIHDAEEGLWALGPASLGGHALPTAQAPELELPDVDGRPFRLSSLRGQKVLIVAWAPY